MVARRVAKRAITGAETGTAHLAVSVLLSPSPQSSPRAGRGGPAFNHNAKRVKSRQKDLTIRHGCRFQRPVKHWMRQVDKG